MTYRARCNGSRFAGKGHQSPKRWRGIVFDPSILVEDVVPFLAALGRTLGIVSERTASAIVGGWALRKGAEYAADLASGGRRGGASNTPRKNPGGRGFDAGGASTHPANPRTPVHDGRREFRRNSRVPERGISGADGRSGAVGRPRPVRVPLAGP